MLKVSKSHTTVGQNLVGLWRPTFTRVDKRIYVFGGGGVVTNELHSLDIQSLVWTTHKDSIGKPPTKRYGHTSSLYGGYIIIFGGSNEFQEYCNDLVLYNIEKKTWIHPHVNGPKVAARYLHTATVYKDKLYVYGGFARNSDCTYVLDELNILDLKTFTWSEPISVPPRYNHSATIVGDKIYIYAGKDESGSTVDDLFSLDLVNLKIHPCFGITGKIELLKSQHFTEAVGNRLLVFGKYICEAIPQAAYGLWALDLTTWKWTQMDCKSALSNGVWNYFTVMEDESKDHTNLLLLGNTEKVRPTPYDHFRDLLSLNLESFGIWTIPPSTVNSDFAYLLNEQELSDFQIVTEEGRTLYVHKVILVARWPHFRSLLQSNMSEINGGRMKVEESYPVMHTFLKYIYQDSFDEESPWHITADVLVLAEMYMVHRLKKICANLLYHKHLRVDTCAYIFQQAVMSQEEGLKVLVVEYIFENYGAVMKTSGLLDMPAHIREDFLECVPDDATLTIMAKKT
ncbi:galactose oxidase [Basidiobolus meristosporus CBS 931.73]|uniref:Galactose oxidase n=1 Tax=Basidiobolus meristosporus CBS 931.73 TaxID=1314790 RepID=A0A1Y1YF75_9FUNG|nr:galactose oxidase [Basidiobolus meristosporus CBS 931.73]|eukprot:ORX96608.1 galactose oxidase [Basidiobolus meristosporus CBS 931.73]